MTLVVTMGELYTLPLLPPVLSMNKRLEKTDAETTLVRTDKVHFIVK